MKCLGLGHMSGRVMVTGGDDRKVNLWSVGKAHCVMVSFSPIVSIWSVGKMHCITICLFVPSVKSMVTWQDTLQCSDFLFSLQCLQSVWIMHCVMLGLFFLCAMSIIMMSDMLGHLTLITLSSSTSISSFDLQTQSLIPFS